MAPATASESTALQKAGAQPSLIKKLANRYGLEEGKFYNTIISVVWPTREKDGKQIAPTPEMVAAFLMVADEYDLNPFMREIYPFLDKGGNLKVIVGVDGWIKAVQRHEQYDGHAFTPHLDADKKVYAITCTINRKDRTHAIEMTEYMAECKRDTDPWKQWPVRMLHHKAFIQTARYAFGMSGIVDEDDAERAEIITVRPIEEPRRLSASTTDSGIPKAQIPQGDVMEQESDSDALVDGADIEKLNKAIYARGLSKADFNDWLKANPSIGTEKMAGLHKRQLPAIFDALPNIPKS